MPGRVKVIWHEGDAVVEHDSWGPFRPAKVGKHDVAGLTPYF